MRILIADDHGLFREGLVLILQSLFSNTELVQVTSWAEVRAVVLEAPVWDLILLDLYMPRAHSCEEELQSLCSSVDQAANICIVSASGELKHVEAALKLGIKGYLPKTSDLSELKVALQKVSQGQLYFPPQYWQSTSVAQMQSSVKMTNRQQQILNLLASGKSNKQIANQLNLTEGTIKRHVYNIFQTFHVKNRVEAIDYARQTGILPIW